MILSLLYLIYIHVATSFRWAPLPSQNNPLAYMSQYESSVEKFPHHVLVYYSRLYCSGSLISSRTVVTCATCFYRRASEPTFVKVGVQHITDSKTYRHRVLEVKTHEFYRRLTPVDNDIALLFLEKNVIFSPAVRKIPLLEPETSLQVGHAFQVTGYGAENVLPQLKNRLLSTAIVVVENDECVRNFGSVMTFSNYCGRMYAPERRLSDNGGGAVLQDLLVGILVIGATIDKQNTAIFTNISYFHRWIVLNVQRFHETYCNNSAIYSEAILTSEEYNN